MKTSQVGIDLIKDYEKFRSTPYPCAAGKPTIGFGHVIKPGESFTRITEQEGIELLKQDLIIAENCVNSAVKVFLSQNQFDALVSFVFNIGCNAFRKSTLLKLLCNGNYYDAAMQFPRWNKSKGQILNGLTRRRKEEMNLFLSQ